MKRYIISMREKNSDKCIISFVHGANNISEYLESKQNEYDLLGLVETGFSPLIVTVPDHMYSEE